MNYISTGGEYLKTPEGTAEYFYENGITNIELSGGSYSAETLNNLKKLKQKGINFSVHNYFPPPAVPFVINLASIDSAIRNMSLEFCKNAIDWSSELESKQYAFHAGFLIDPNVNELGKKITKKTLAPREEATNLFIDNTNELARYAKSKGVKLLIENNVLTTKNLNEFEGNPLLLTTAEEIVDFFQKIDKSVGLLLDVAHLKVTANTLSLNLKAQYKEVYSLISGYHLSDNDGTSDSNEAFDENLWCFNDLNQKLNYYTIEVYNTHPSELDKMSVLLNRKIND